MPPKPRKIVTKGITRVCLKGDGWIEIQPDTFNFTSLNFYLSAGDGAEDVFSGMSYLGFEFRGKTNGRLYCVSADGLSAIEIDDGGGK